jgi:uncharacterized coiled-coil protein SlyX
MDRIAELESQTEIQRRRIAELERALAASEAKTTRAVIEGHLRDAVARTPDLHPAAAADVVRRALESGQWQLDSQGRLLRLSEGVPDVTAEGEYVSPREWIKGLRVEAPHLFAQTQQGAGTGQKNPWARDSRNVTEQMRLYRSNPELARRLAAEHGVKI